MSDRERATQLLAQIPDYKMSIIIAYMQGVIDGEDSPRYNQETEDAMQEARDIMTGRISVKSYSSTQELFDELDEE